MTTVAKITAELEVNASKFTQGVKQAEAQTASLAQKLKYLDQQMRASTGWLGQHGKAWMQAGKQMTMFMTVPILGFFGMIIKKAMDADTALGQMARESMGKLNEQLVILGTKFLPLFIQFVDWLTRMVDKFNQASPATQKFITMLVLLVAMIGPAVSLVGALMRIVTAAQTVGTVVSGLGISFSSVIPAVLSFGASMWAALAPLLPILALIAAAILLVYLVWNNWDQLKVTVQQLGAITKHAFSSMAQDGKKAFQDIQRGAGQAGQQIGASIAKWIVTAKQKFNELRTGAMNVINGIVRAFQGGFMSLMNIARSVFQAIANAIGQLIGYIRQLVSSLASIVLPDALTPGSPTPFEIGLRGIGDAMDALSSKSLPEFNAGLKAAPANISNANGGRSTYIDNRTFSGGMNADELRVALDRKFATMAGNL